MTPSGMTTMELRKINRSNIYTFIYEQKESSKQHIVDSLHLSLSTVSQNLKLLEAEGLIRYPGYYQSTGGRKARRIEIVPDAAAALGVGILKDKVHLAVIDLYGTVQQRRTEALPFEMSGTYCRELEDLILSFFQEFLSSHAQTQPAGIGIAIQGVISADGTQVSYGRILNNTGLQLKDIASRLPCKSLLFHDSKAAAEAELWNLPRLRDAVVFLLNDNLGGALILDRRIHSGQHMYGGLLEHISLSADGPLCYCGSRGCLETFLSAGSLKSKTGCDLDTFFSRVRNGEENVRSIWLKYLDTLAFAIRNLQAFTDGSTIISGLLNSYMTQEDYAYLDSAVQRLSPFPEQKSALIAGAHGAFAPAIGSALFFIKDWLHHI